MTEMDYLPEKPIGLSRQNEPEISFVVSSDIRKYPDMRSVYETFRMKMNISTNRSIVLGNGFEGVFKTVLLAMKPKSMFYFTPQWAMVDIICDQYGIQKSTSEYTFDGSGFSTGQLKQAECAYLTVHNGSLFGHKDINIDQVSEIYKIVILDISYCSLDDMKDMLNIRNENVIVVGSFDKIYGCGLRCGFCSFDPLYTERMMLCRERYVSSQVEEFIMSTNFVQPESGYLNRILEEFGDIIITHSHNYVTIIDNGHVMKSNSKPFMVGECKFIRMGIPSSEIEYSTLRQDLRNARYSREEG